MELPKKLHNPSAPLGKAVIVTTQNYAIVQGGIKQQEKSVNIQHYADQARADFTSTQGSLPGNCG